jgi:hypothetical protein
LQILREHFSAARFAPMTLIGGRLNQISVLPAKIGFRSPRATRTSRIGARSFAASAHVGSWQILLQKSKVAGLKILGENLRSERSLIRMTSIALPWSPVNFA